MAKKKRNNMKSQWRRSLLVCIFIYLSLLCILRDHLLPENIFGTQKKHTISPEQNFTCIWSIVENREICKPVCNHGFFGLYGMAKCHPLLTCGDIEQLKFSEEIGHMGYVKEARYYLCILKSTFIQFHLDFRFGSEYRNVMLPFSINIRFNNDLS